MQAKVGTDMTHIDLREGLKLRFEAGAYSPRTLFMITAACSAMLGNKPVRCVGVLPGVSLLVHVRGHDPSTLGAFTDALWAQTQHHIESWIEMADRFPCMALPLDGAHVTLAISRTIALDKGVMQLEVSPLGSAPEAAAASPAPEPALAAREASTGRGGAPAARWWHKIGRRATPPRP